MSFRAFSHLKIQTSIFVTMSAFYPVSFSFMLQLCERTKELYITYLCTLVITYVCCASRFLTSIGLQTGSPVLWFPPSLILLGNCCSFSDFFPAGSLESRPPLPMCYCGSFCSVVCFCEHLFVLNAFTVTLSLSISR